VNPDFSESEFIEQEAPTPGGDIRDGDSLVRTWESEENDEPERDPDGFINKELAAELDLALGDDDVDESKG
jgi:transcription initiation factor TFIID subunit 7